MYYKKFLTIAIIAGETSGDILGAGLIHALMKKKSNIRFVGVTGPHMRDSGCKSWYDIEELEIMGIFETLKHLPRLVKIRRDIINRLILLKPDIFIGIDAPDFNLSIEYHLKKHGIKTVHYVSPSIWAWRKKRIFKIKKSVDLMLTLFPFEKEIYDRINIPCLFIGHRLADIIPLKPNKILTRTKLDIKKNTYCLAILPGSRKTEIKMLTSIFLKTALLLKIKWPKLQIVTALKNKKSIDYFLMIKKKIAPHLIIKIFEGRAQDVMISSDVALLTSGTITLECMLSKCPMVVAYRMNFFTFWLIKKMIKIKYISLPNLLHGSQLIKEFIQKNCNPKNLSIALDHLLKKKDFTMLLKKFEQNHKKIKCNADQKAAEAILSIIRL